MIKIFVLVTFLVSSVSAAKNNEVDLPRVSTQFGDVIGSWAEGAKTSEDSPAPKVAQFMGIPYAQPPVGELRFEKPQPWTQKWSPEPLQALKASAQCLQPKINKYTAIFQETESEDCLYLNIWVPEKSSEAEKLPVMVWIHGGGFALGAGSWFIYNGRILAASQKVIVVTINYRLGISGFTYSGPAETDLPGNQGLWDQNMALRWVQENIESFGGNPQEVTLFGESAGSWSVGAQLTSPHSRGLFKNAIMQSGALLIDGQVCTSLAVQGARAIAAKADCPTSGPELKTCLKKLSVDQLKDIFTETHLHATYGDDFLPVSTREALATGNGVNTGVNLLVGTMEDEGSFILVEDLPDVFSKAKPLDINLDHGKSLLKILFKDQPLVDQLEKFYLGSDECSAGNPARIREGIIRAVSDGLLGCPAVEFGRLLATLQKAQDKPNKVYGYHFKKASSFSVTCKDMDWVLGPCHADDLPLVFGLPYMMPAMFSDDERSYADTVMKIWGGFARTGAPPAQGETAWPPHDDAQMNVMQLFGVESENKLASADPFPQCRLWTRMAQNCWDSPDQIITFAMMLPGHH